MWFALDALFADVPAEQVDEARDFYRSRVAGRGPGTRPGRPCRRADAHRAGTGSAARSGAGQSGGGSASAGRSAGPPGAMIQLRGPALSRVASFFTMATR